MRADLALIFFLLSLGGGIVLLALRKKCGGVPLLTGGIVLLICAAALALYLAAAVLLGALLWAVTRSNAKVEQAASAAAEGSIPLSSFAAEDLEQIEYTYNGETYTLQYLSLIHI